MWNLIDQKSSRLVVIAVMVATLASAAYGQTPPPPTPAVPGAGRPVPLTSPPQRPPRSPEAVANFVDNLTTTDSSFEVFVGQARILTTKKDIAAAGKRRALVAVGDPTTIDFQVVSPRQIRITGSRIGVTDLSITTSDDETYVFEVRVIADLTVLKSKIQSSFPDASIKVSQLRDHVILEGQARDTAQIGRILEMVRAELASIQAAQATKVTGEQKPGAAAPRAPGETAPKPAEASPPQGEVSGELPAPLKTEAKIPPAQIINLLRIPGSQQVLLKVRVAELNRTGLRAIGADLIFANGANVVGTQIGGGTIAAESIFNPGRGLSVNTDPNRTRFSTTQSSTTVFGIFEPNFEFLLRALRQNQILKLLAEPNLVAMNGQQASFLAGGQIPIPVPQSGAGGGAPTITIQYKDFGVSLGFVPYILDGDVIRLTVDPEVSAPDPTLSTTVAPGFSSPAFNTRKAHTTVELREGQTLAIAGLLAVTMEGSTSRIPGLGDLPILGPLFSNTSSTRTEKELIILVTPYLVEPMRADQLPTSPGEEVNGPTDFEFFLLNRLEGRTGRDWRATTEYDDALGVVRCMIKCSQERVRGPHGFCD
jgi:pilus assembly protein CpaC